MDDLVASGAPCWADLSASDVGVARHFYQQLLGWTVTTTATPMGDHHVGSVGGRDVAGMTVRPSDDQPSVWTVFFFVDDLAATVGAASEAGGAVLQPAFQIPTGASVAVIADPGGAMFGLLSGRPQPGPYLSMAEGAVSWVELMTRRPASARDFYGHVLGWEADTQDAGGVDYTVFQIDEEPDPVAGIIATPPGLPTDIADGWSVYFAVADCIEAERQAKALGGSVARSSTPVPVGSFAVLVDPTGATFQIMEYSATAG